MLVHLVRPAERGYPPPAQSGMIRITTGDARLMWPKGVGTLHRYALQCGSFAPGTFRGVEYSILHPYSTYSIDIV